MKGYLIDPATRTIEPVEIGDDYMDINRAIGSQMFTIARLGEDDIFVDDEGLFNGKAEEGFIEHPDYPQPLAGKGLVLGVKGAESVDPHRPIEHYREVVKFATIQELQERYS